MKLLVTPSAVEKICALMVAENDFLLRLRVSISGGGCQGFQYGFAFELEKELTLDENTRHLLNQVEHALVMIQKKKYGICENCNEAIPVARLEAIPYSTQCKNCAALIES